MKKTLLIFPDQLSGRVFFECGIVRELLLKKNHFECLFNYPVFEKWKSGCTSNFFEMEDFLQKENLFKKVHCLVDSFLDRQIGFFPLALRFNLQHGFHAERMSFGHANAYLDLSRIGLLPRNAFCFSWMSRWLYSGFRHVNTAIYKYLKDHVSLLVTSNLQHPMSIPFLLAARRLDIPIIGYIASWDHLVGKGIVYPFCRRYIVQNATMKKNLATYHGISHEMVTVTGWPQADVYAKKGDRLEYQSLLENLNLDKSKPVVLIAGNSETNAPYEPQFFKRLIAWWLSNGRKYNLIFRPHPRDLRWKERFDFVNISAHEGLHVQNPSFTDFDTLTLLLQHVDVVITNAGTILLDSLINDRPVVSVLYDEGSSGDGANKAYLNVLGEHYKELMQSNAFHKAFSFDEVTRSIETCIGNPKAKETERKSVCSNIVGPMDGKAAERVAKIILDYSDLSN